jgi:hypothetical protein
MCLQLETQLHNQTNKTHTFQVNILIYLIWYILSGGSSTVHIYTQTVHRTTQNKQYHNKTNIINPFIVISAPHNMPYKTARTNCLPDDEPRWFETRARRRRQKLN